MSNPGPTITNALNSSAAATANFLSSLSSSLGAGALSGLFENLLESVQTATTQPNATTVSGGGSVNFTPSSDNGDTGLSGGMGDLMTALQNFAAKWNNYQNNNHGHNNQNGGNVQSQNNASSTPSSAAVSSATASTNSSATTGTVNSSDTASASTGNSSTTGSTGNSNTDPSAPPSFADLLAQLQGILHMIQKQLEAAKQAGTGDAQAVSSTTDTTNSSAQDLLAAGGALGDLLALGQMLEKKLGLASTDAASSGSANSAATPDLASLDTQLRANLKNLMDSLQAATSSNANETAVVSDAADGTDANVTTTGLTLVATSVAATAGSDTAVSTPNEIIANALATADDFLKQLNSLYGTPVSASALTTAVTANTAVATGGGNGSSLDAGPDNGNAPTTANTASATAQNTDVVSTPSDTSKATNPYSFASQLSALRAQNGGTTGLPGAVEQVLLQLNRNAASGNDQMSIQLHPADLGTINVKLDIGSDGTVSGTVVASNADTLQMLQKDSRSLERALQEAGLRADPGSLQFSLGGQQQNNNSGQTAQNPSGSGGPSNGTGTGLTALTTDAANDTTDNWVITPGRVNIRV